ncbi:type II toxin-antitoxin system PemK/MazF family toxin [Saccharothrix sp. Mg75]|uniref:type II toxin-antitoxin system PemK/MazF family toxin n=1 Tax=Saccharothrix sp. Mg75 TaxID=3445357 RepID=UPI003EEBFC5F
MRLIGKFIAQWLAAGYLTFPAVYLWVSQNDPGRLVGNDFLLVNACVAPVAAVWVVLRHRRVRLGFWWAAARVVVLLALSGVVTWYAMDPVRVGVRELDPTRIAVLLVFLWAWIAGSRLLDRALGAPARRGGGVVWRGDDVRPGRGEVWSALVPFEEGSHDGDGQRAKDRPCVVVSTFARHAYVLKITSVDQGDRPGYLALPAGWHPWSEKASWVKLEPLIKVSYLDFRQHVRDAPERAWAAIEERYPPDATPQRHTPSAKPRTPRRGPRSRRDART